MHDIVRAKVKHHDIRLEKQVISQFNPVLGAIHAGNPTVDYIHATGSGPPVQQVFHEPGIGQQVVHALVRGGRAHAQHATNPGGLRQDHVIIPQSHVVDGDERSPWLPWPRRRIIFQVIGMHREILAIPERVFPVFP